LLVLFLSGQNIVGLIIPSLGKLTCSSLMSNVSILCFSVSCVACAIPVLFPLSLWRRMCFVGLCLFLSYCLRILHFCMMVPAYYYRSVWFLFFVCFYGCIDFWCSGFYI
jgi:hypothetical protein